ncbi:hypothetical protein NDU88_006391 [Pleurodeles waltl]|uniref:Uncharacterized protein n=1 Tax=Pleurodeles waltl TaxID=8319 RepID=A0AAV7TYD2_PLEWA|nr:hypothetical protein NDU88_006391 [Pleurodeles waltl]
MLSSTATVLGVSNVKRVYGCDKLTCLTWQNLRTELWCGCGLAQQAGLVTGAECGPDHIRAGGASWSAEDVEAELSPAQAGGGGERSWGCRLPYPPGRQRGWQAGAAAPMDPQEQLGSGRLKICADSKGRIAVPAGWCEAAGDFGDVPEGEEAWVGGGLSGPCRPWR